VILLSEPFRKDVQDYLNNYFEQEQLIKRNNKIIKLLEKCEKILGSYEDYVIYS